MKIFLVLAALAPVGAVWTFDRLTAVTLRTQIEAKHLQIGDRDSLQRDHERLARLQVEPEERATLERDAAELARLNRELAARPRATIDGVTSQLKIGEWLRSATWQNRGRATPTTTVETALWAAAGGDVELLRQMIHLDETARAKAGAILAQLPASARAVYATADQLVAAFTAKSVPLGDAQLVWQHQPNPDEAYVCVFIKQADVAGEKTAAPLPRGPNDPPTGPPNVRTRATYLSLRRSDAGWQLVVPLNAVEKIATELAGRTAK
jgi:hypothetical protein